MMSIEERIYRFIVENFLFGEKNGLGWDDSLIESGTIDSTGVLELIAFLEEKYCISVEDEDVLPENLDSIRSAASYVRKKKIYHQVVPEKCAV